jgi:hypothetical protein
MRVKKIAPARDEFNVVPIGTEGVIVAPGPLNEEGAQWLVRYENFRFAGDSAFYAYSYMLAPLVPPSEWADEAIRKLLRDCERKANEPREMDREELSEIRGGA